MRNFFGYPRIYDLSGLFFHNSESCTGDFLSVGQILFAHLDPGSRVQHFLLKHKYLIPLFSCIGGVEFIDCRIFQISGCRLQFLHVISAIWHICTEYRQSLLITCQRLQQLILFDIGITIVRYHPVAADRIAVEILRRIKPKDRSLYGRIFSFRIVRFLMNPDLDLLPGIDIGGIFCKYNRRILIFIG